MWEIDVVYYAINLQVMFIANSSSKKKIDVFNWLSIKVETKIVLRQWFVNLKHFSFKIMIPK